MVAKIFQEETDYLYRIFSFEYAEEQLREGNLFFVHGCSWGKLIFHNTDDEVDIFHGLPISLKVMFSISPRRKGPSITCSDPWDWNTGTID